MDTNETGYDALDSDDLLERALANLTAKDSRWAVVTSYGQHYIGHVNTDVFQGVFEKALKTSDNWVRLFPAFEFSAPLIPSPRLDPRTGQQIMGMGRQPFVSTPHFCVEPLPVLIQVTSFYLFRDMKEKDRETYKKFVDAALEQTKAERLARSNLVAPTSKEVKNIIRQGPGSA